MASSNSLGKHKKAAASEFTRLTLNEVNFSDLFGLKHDFSPKSGCNGPSLSQWESLINGDEEQKETRKKRKKTAPYHIQELQKSLDNRYYHLVESRLDEKRKMWLNNAREYFKVHCALRFRYWATKGSSTDGSASWSHCYHQICNNTAPTEEYLIEGEVASEPPSKPGEADALADDVITIPSDDSFQAETSQQNKFDDAALLCLCGRSLHDVQSLLDHGRLCETVPESARAKSDRICQDECVYHCIMKARTKGSWKHRNRKHFICQHCGEIATWRSGHGASSPQLINPVGYFLRPKKEFQKWKPDQVIERVFGSLSSCEAKDLDELDDAQLLFVCRKSLRRQAALISSDSPTVKDGDLESHQDAAATSLDPGNDTDNRNNPERLLESNAPASPLRQGPHITADSPTVVQSDCTRFESMEIVDQTPVSSPVQPPSPSFSLPADGQVSLHSAPALPPEDDPRASSGLSTCEDEPSQPLYSQNDSLSNGSGAPPHPARPDTTPNVEPLPSSGAAGTTTDRSPTTEIDKRRPGQDATEDRGGAVIISKNSASVSSRQQDSLSAVDCPTPIEINHTLPEHTEGGRSTTIENLSTASPSPPTSLSGYDIDGRAPTGVDMPFSREPSAIDSGVESAGTDNSITASQASLVSTSKGTATSRKRPIGNEGTESSGTQAKKARTDHGSLIEGNASAMGVAQGDEAEGHIIFPSSCGGSDATSNALKDPTYILEPSTRAEYSTTNRSTVFPPPRLSSSSGQSQRGSNARQPSPSINRQTASNDCAYTFDGQTSSNFPRYATTTNKEHPEVTPYISNGGNSYLSLPRNDMQIARYPSQEKEQLEPHKSNKPAQPLHSTEVSDLYRRYHDPRSCSTLPLELNGCVNPGNVQDSERTPWLASGGASVYQDRGFDAEAKLSRNQAELDAKSHPVMPATETTLGCHQEHQNQNGDHLPKPVTYKYISSQKAISYLRKCKLVLPRAMLTRDTTHSWLTYFPVKSAIERLESFKSEDGEWRDFTPCPPGFRDSEECLNLLSKNLDHVRGLALFMRFPNANLSQAMPCHLVFYPSPAISEALAQLPSFYTLND